LEHGNPFGSDGPIDEFEKGRAFYSFTFFFAGSVAIYRAGATFKGVTVYSLMVVIVLICFVLITKAY